jgi:hypothetical protein
MNKLHVTAIAGLLAFAAVLGTIAATHTVTLGAAHRQSADTTVRKRAKQLDRFEASLRRALAQKPPKLPAVPKPPAVSRPAAAPAPQPQVVYRRPPPVVVVKHTHHGDDGSESEASGGGDGGGGDD